jgi:hypothetical protein
VLRTGEVGSWNAQGIPAPAGSTRTCDHHITYDCVDPHSARHSSPDTTCFSRQRCPLRHTPRVRASHHSESRAPGGHRQSLLQYPTCRRRDRRISTLTSASNAAQPQERVRDTARGVCPQQRGRTRLSSGIVGGYARQRNTVCQDPATNWTVPPRELFRKTRVRHSLLVTPESETFPTTGTAPSPPPCSGGRIPARRAGTALDPQLVAEDRLRPSPPTRPTLSRARRATTTS